VMLGLEELSETFNVDVDVEIEGAEDGVSI
jgi:hypothetical protein